jgi:hypothetical protein
MDEDSESVGTTVSLFFYTVVYRNKQLDRKLRKRGQTLYAYVCEKLGATMMVLSDRVNLLDVPQLAMVCAKECSCCRSHHVCWLHKRPRHDRYVIVVFGRSSALQSDGTGNIYETGVMYGTRTVEHALDLEENTLQLQWLQSVVCMRRNSYKTSEATSSTSSSSFSESEESEEEEEEDENSEQDKMPGPVLNQHDRPVFKMSPLLDDEEETVPSRHESAVLNQHEGTVSVTTPGEPCKTLKRDSDALDIEEPRYDYKRQRLFCEQM